MVAGLRAYASPLARRIRENERFGLIGASADLCDAADRRRRGYLT